MTRQEAFDIVAKHLAEQGTCATVMVENQPMCAYRGENGTKCAFGVLIPDTHYQYWMEGNRVNHLVARFKNTLQDFMPFFEFWETVSKDEYFYCSLQQAHDNAFPFCNERGKWFAYVASSLALIAKNYNLDSTVLLQYFPSKEG